jgi:hypothetical protein
MSDSKLEKLLTQLDKISDRFEKAKLSDEKKDEILSKIIALKEIIEEKLESNTIDSEEIDIEALLDIE